MDDPGGVGGDSGNCIHAYLVAHDERAGSTWRGRNRGISRVGQTRQLSCKRTSTTTRDPSRKPSSNRYLPALDGALYHPTRMPFRRWAKDAHGGEGEFADHCGLEGAVWKS